MRQFDVIVRNFLVLLCALSGLGLCAQNACQALSAPEHIVLWERSTGFPSDHAQVQRLWREIQKAIDDYGTFYDQLRLEFPGMSFRREYHHRIFFHWGYNADPRRSGPLSDLLGDWMRTENSRRATSDEEALAPAEREELSRRFYEAVIAEQRRRNRNIAQAVRQVTGLDGRPVDGLATILYNIHILGDYQTAAVAGLPSMDALVRDTARQGFLRLTNEREVQLSKRIESDLYAAVAANSGFPRRQSEAMLQVIEGNLPEVLERLFGNTLAKKGIRIASRSESTSDSSYQSQ